MGEMPKVGSNSSENQQETRNEPLDFFEKAIG
jgi:hypothetical protein